MKLRNIATLLWLLVFALGVQMTLAADLKVGDPVPSFRLLGSDGQWYTPEQFKGKKGIVIAWFPKAFTGG